MQKIADIMDILPIRQEDLSVGDFAEMARSAPWMIARSTIVPPRLGESGFGSIRVEYSRPQYRALRNLSACKP